VVVRPYSRLDFEDLELRFEVGSLSVHRLLVGT
jgi:hypothetical protein